MKSKRIVKGNNIIIPSGAEVYSANLTNAVTHAEKRGKGNTPIPSYSDVLEAREFMEENKK